jgi:hypothetical protein
MSLMAGDAIEISSFDVTSALVDSSFIKRITFVKSKNSPYGFSSTRVRPLSSSLSHLRLRCSGKLISLVGMFADA